MSTVRFVLGKRTRWSLWLWRGATWVKPRRYELSYFTIWAFGPFEVRRIKDHAW